MKFAVTRINETRDTIVLDAESEKDAFDAFHDYTTFPIGKHTVTQERFEVRPVREISEADVIHDAPEAFQ